MVTYQVTIKCHLGDFYSTFFFSATLFTAWVLTALHSSHLLSGCQLRVNHIYRVELKLVAFNGKKHCFYRFAQSTFYCGNLVERNWMRNRNEGESGQKKNLLPFDYCFISSQLTLMLYFFFLFVIFCRLPKNEFQPQVIRNADVEISHSTLCIHRTR